MVPLYRPNPRDPQRLCSRTESCQLCHAQRRWRSPLPRRPWKNRCHTDSDSYPCSNVPYLSSSLLVIRTMARTIPCTRMLGVHASVCLQCHICCMSSQAMLLVLRDTYGSWHQKTEPVFLLFSLPVSHSYPCSNLSCYTVIHDLD